jgi:hypothetical protein
VFSFVQRWWADLRRRRERRIADAGRLLRFNPETAYYDAHRLAARARFSGDVKGFAHWARVAAEVARLSNNPMDIDVVQAIVDEEERRAARTGAQ